MKKSFTLVLAGAALLAAFAQPAEAAGRPTNGCAAAYTLTPVSVLQDLAQQTPDQYFVDLDANKDGFLCNKFLPDASTNVGVARDNFVAGY